MKTEKQIIQQAKNLCEKFINKVENGKARSKETYQECKDLFRSIRMFEEGITEQDVYDTMPEKSNL